MQNGKSKMANGKSKMENLKCAFQGIGSKEFSLPDNYCARPRSAARRRAALQIPCACHGSRPRRRGRKPAQADDGRGAQRAGQRRAALEHDCTECPACGDAHVVDVRAVLCGECTGRSTEIARRQVLPFARSGGRLLKRETLPREYSSV